MTDVTTVISTVAPVAEGEFRIGRVFGRTFSLLSRNFPIYFVVATVAAVPGAVFENSGSKASGASGAWSLLAFVLMLALNALSQAIMLHTAFQDMCGRSVSLIEGLRIGFSRFLPLIGLSICCGLAIAFGALLLVVPAFIFMTMLYVATPACIVERLGVFASMARSSALTKGHRWPVFAMILLVTIPGAVMAVVVKSALGLAGSVGLVMVGSLVWAGLASAFGVIFAVAIYHDLRVAKEGIDTSQIAAVFD
jgi:hypothetical protein